MPRGVNCRIALVLFARFLMKQTRLNQVGRMTIRAIYHINSGIGAFTANRRLQIKLEDKNGINYPCSFMSTG